MPITELCLYRDKISDIISYILYEMEMTKIFNIDLVIIIVNPLYVGHVELEARGSRLDDVQVSASRQHGNGRHWWVSDGVQYRPRVPTLKRRGKIPSGFNTYKSDINFRWTLPFPSNTKYIKYHDNDIIGVKGELEGGGDEDGDVEHYTRFQGLLTFINVLISSRCFPTPFAKSIATKHSQKIIK